MSFEPAPPRSPHTARNPVLRLFTSIWFGVILLILIVIYSSVISALAPVRWALEMTEMQAFRHWVFVALTGLLALSVLAATFFRTRWIALNAGALITHVGLLLLIGGATAYFGAKVEGNVLLQSPRIEVRVTRGTITRTVAHFPATAGTSWSRRLPDTLGLVQLEVEAVRGTSLDPPTEVELVATLDDEPPQRVTLRAAAAEWHPVVPNLEVRLRTYPPQTNFYDNEQPALYVRQSAAGRGHVLPIHGLPIYYEHYLTNDGLLSDSAGQPVPPRRERPEINVGGMVIPTGWFERWDMPLRVDTADLPFEITITGYVPYAVGLRTQELPDGSKRPRPVLATAEERRTDISARAMSAIRLAIRPRGASTAATVTRWCQFNIYPDLDPQALVFTLPGSDQSWEIVYSRQRYSLGALIAARHLYVEYFPGRRSIESYHSEIAVQHDRDRYNTVVETNETATVGPWTLYQSGFAEDHWSYSILGVGNRIGMLPMNIGWVLITLGCLYAFYAKPVLLRRARKTVSAAAVLLLALILPGCTKPAPYDASAQAVTTDQQVDWSRGRLLAVQAQGRYKTLDSFARESLKALTGSEHLPGLSPLASLCELLFNRDAYQDTPIVKIRNSGLRARLVRPLPEDRRQRIESTKRFTPRELFNPAVEQVLARLETDPVKRRAVNRVREAQAIAARLDEFLTVVPQPGGDEVSPWFTPRALLGNLTDQQLAQLGVSRDNLPRDMRRGVPGVSPADALAVTIAWTSLRVAWLQGDAAATQTYIDRLTAVLPQLAGDGMYPSQSQRAAEARYYAAGKFTYGWWIYFLALLISIVALVTGWRVPWLLSVLLIVAGLAIHVYGLSLRWYILDRIPVANMFEAVVASAAIGIIIALLVELLYEPRVLLVGASMTGFLALVAGQFILPGSELGTIPAILDDIQLRLHTVMVISAYALIFLAAVVAFIYLLGYYGVRFKQLVAGPATGHADVPLDDTAQVGELRPVLAGATPGDEVRRNDLPAWLHRIDWSHLIILNLVFVLLFVGGIILGAWWADYSWGRPWGWDPKEVFALNTWLVYAVLLHVRFVVRNRGLWTAWLSIAGCLMMAFNWFFVNFFIASVHSYA